MTVKEFNLLKRKMWDVLMENPEISHKVKTCGKAIVYNISDFHNRAIMIVNNPKQVNDNTIAEKGMDAEKCDIRKLFTISADQNIAFFDGYNLYN